MPMMTSVTPQSVAASTMVFMPPIMDSQPSRPKRLAVLNLVARTFSNFSAKARRSRTCVRSSSVSGFRGTSMRDRSQFCLQRFVMCSASTPTVPQYLCGTQIYGAFVLNRRVDLHAIDAHPTHWLISTQATAWDAVAVLNALRFLTFAGRFYLRGPLVGGSESDEEAPGEVK